VLQGYHTPDMNKFMSVQYHSIEEVQVQLDWYEQLVTKQEGIWWGICLKETGEMIGNGGFHNWLQQHRIAELGYWILPAWQGKGYAQEAIAAMCKHAFTQMNIHRIEAIVEGENTASMNLLVKCGFIKESCRMECEIKNGRFIDLWCFALFNPAD
jgi:ribosomal-protein-alanine N-acetyltransferase